MEIKERILKTAESLFRKFGIRSVSMDDIASELGISKKTIYQNFEDKDSIVYEIARTNMVCDIEESERIYKESANPIEQVFKETTLLRKQASTINPAVFYDLKKYHPKTWQLFQEYNKVNFLEIVKQNLREGIAQGYYREDINIEILSRLRMEEVEFAFSREVFPPDSFNQMDVHTTLIDHFLRGIMTPKGLAFYEKCQQDAHLEHF
ncbi:TetR/AcrR family transcriptional regulator [Emticicia sp. 21SJ11W-3]|uniref:TetR/AcrR family transcriptional regulator n=1 Tax=Emticicia sp. 21SJ11W-3 TaxID=2916755 RepID=UPI00209E2E08|nr:TetR/AcrR family transcriptional regulator [Emticicia sp. 21SJ11W-3]UTA68184.1 TetR/AcrR family transcriptional regulator [Emticicia sp. 21SJ11W-3]